MFTKVSKWKKGTHYLCKTCTKCLRISETILWVAAAFSLCRHTRPLSPATSGIAWRGGAVVFTTWIWLHPEPGPSQGGSHNCTSFRVLIFWTWTIRWTWLMRIITGSLQGLLRSILQCGEIWKILKGILIYLLWPSPFIMAEMVFLQAHMLLVEGIGRNFGLRHLVFDLFSSQGVSPNSGWFTNLSNQFSNWIKKDEVDASILAMIAKTNVIFVTILPYFMVEAFLWAAAFCRNGFVGEINQNCSSTKLGFYGNGGQRLCNRWKIWKRDK